MSTLTMDLSSEQSVVAEKACEKNGFHKILTISILSGPVAYLICRAMSDAFGGQSQALALAAFSVIGFELVWLCYGACVLLRKGS